MAKYFNPNSQIDNFGDFKKLSPALLEKADALRELAGHPIYVTSGYRKGDKNAHGKGLALDVMCLKVPLIELYKLAETLDFSGIGIYPHWRWDGIEYGGLHIDTWTAGRRWMGIRPNPSAPQQYIALTNKNIERWLSVMQKGVKI